MGIEHLEIQDRLSARGYGELSVTRGMIIVYQVGSKWLLDWTKADDFMSTCPEGSSYSRDASVLE